MWLPLTAYLLSTKILFDRVLVAQASVEGITLLTNDSVISQCPGPITVL
jgi:PIN domain nuclease of toxin-antitoxin system